VNQSPSQETKRSVSLFDWPSSIAAVALAVVLSVYFFALTWQFRTEWLVFGVLLWTMFVGLWIFLEENRGLTSAAAKVIDPHDEKQTTVGDTVQSGGNPVTDELLLSALEGRIGRLRTSFDNQRQLCLAVLGVDAVVAAIVASSPELQNRIGTMTGLSVVLLVFQLLLSIGFILLGAMSFTYRRPIPDAPSNEQLWKNLRGEEAALDEAEARQTVRLYIGVVIQVAVGLVALIAMAGR
jgi:hypothetical protein